MNGRDLHIHIVVFKKGSTSKGRVEYTKSVEPEWVFTTQFYFDPAFTFMVGADSPDSNVVYGF